MIVVDTNVIAYLLLPQSLTEAAEHLHKQDPHWAAPVLWRSEFRNILAGYLRRKTLTFDEACAIQQEAQDLMKGGQFDVESLDVLSLVHGTQCTAYDCEFVALALQLETKLVTADTQLLRAFPAVAVPLT